MNTDAAKNEGPPAVSSTKPDEMGFEQVENSMPKSDFDDPHRAALEDNPNRPEPLSLTTIGAIFVTLQLVSNS